MSKKWDEDFESVQNYIPNNWDDEDKENVDVKDNWDDEDKDDVKDNWDDEDIPEKPKPEVSSPRQKKKKTFKQILAEKDEKAVKEKEEKMQKLEANKIKLSPGDILNEKLKRKKMQEDSDLDVAIDSLDLSEKHQDVKLEKMLDKINPISKEEFDEFQTMLVAKLRSYDKSPYFVAFVADMCRDLCSNMDTGEIKKISTTLTTLSNEKVKAAKANTKKKNNKKSTLKVDATKDVFDDYEGDNGVGDFM